MARLADKTTKRRADVEIGVRSRCPVGRKELDKGSLGARWLRMQVYLDAEFMKSSSAPSTFSKDILHKEVVTDLFSDSLACVPKRRKVHFQVSFPIGDMQMRSCLPDTPETGMAWPKIHQST